MFKSYGKAIKNYGNFHDRTRRRDFWLFHIENAVITAVLGAVLGVIAQKTGNTQMVDLSQANLPPQEVMTGWPQTIASLYSLFIFIPRLSLLFRRLHDSNKSGWNILWLLLPIIGWIIFAIRVLFIRGTVGANKYGADPKDPQAISLT